MSLGAWVVVALCLAWVLGTTWAYQELRTKWIDVQRERDEVEAAAIQERIDRRDAPVSSRGVSGVAPLP